MQERACGHAGLPPSLNRSGAAQVGGLRDTVAPYNPHDNSGTGWTFGWADAGAFRDAIGNALYTFREFRPSFRRAPSLQLQRASCRCLVVVVVYRPAL